MRRSSVLSLAFLLSFLLCVPPQVSAQEKPEEGKDWVAVPAVGEGLCVNNLFQSNMVIQRDKAVRVWGWAAAGEQVTVSFAGQSQKVKADKDRLWQVELTAMKASSTPQNMMVKGASKTLTFENILIGDVWILGGQSNMEFPIGRIEGGKTEVHSANFNNIRHMTMPRKSSQTYQKSFSITQKWDKGRKSHVRDHGYWQVCSPETIGNLSGIGYIFARRIHMAAQVPIGVIDTSVGGSTLESWTPYAAVKTVDGAETKKWVAEQEEYLAAYDPKEELDVRIQRKKAWLEKMKKLGRTVRPVNSVIPSDLKPPNIKAGNLYGGMIAPLAGSAAKGIIWHQGYNNCFESSLGATRYGQIFPAMIKAWRAAFNDPKLAFGIISLCTADNQSADDYLEKMHDVGANIREAQYKTFLDLRKAGDKSIGFTSGYDQRRAWYHPGLKIPLGERMAKWALNTQYGFDTRWEPPYLKEMTVEDGSLVLAFNVKGPLGTVPEGPIVGFAIAGEDGKFQSANAELLVTGKDKNGKVRRDSSRVVLTSPLVSKPVHFRYAWARNPHANLVSGWDKLPLATQRSDTWTLSDMYQAYTGKKPTNTIDKLEGNESGDLKKALITADLERRLYEARALLKQHEDTK
jgi:sialate O-acetylesterase